MAAQRQTLHLVEADPVEDTRAFWASWSGETVTRDEAKEINRNVTRFFDLLAEWDEKAGDKAAEGSQP